MQTHRDAPAAPAPAPLRNARSLARLLDTAFTIPGTGFRVGLDPILGLVPGIGDFAGVVLSLPILFHAARLGVPRTLLLRMGVNIGIEALVGAIPLIGDLFDAGWRANVRNVRLMEAFIADPRRAAKSGSRWLIGTAAGVGAVLLALVGTVAWLVISMLRLLGFG